MQHVTMEHTSKPDQNSSMFWEEFEDTMLAQEASLAIRAAKNAEKAAKKAQKAADAERANLQKAGRKLAEEQKAHAIQEFKASPEFQLSVKQAAKQMAKKIAKKQIMRAQHKALREMFYMTYKKMMSYKVEGPGGFAQHKEKKKIAKVLKESLQGDRFWRFLKSG